jgi:hypothetical protein
MTLGCSKACFTPGTKLPQPGGEKKHFTLADRRGILKLIASPDGKDNSLKIQQDVEMYSTLIHKGNHMIHELRPGRKAWLHVVKGRIDLSGLLLHAGDGAGFTDETAVSFHGPGTDRDPPLRPLRAHPRENPIGSLEPIGNGIAGESAP